MKRFLTAALIATVCLVAAQGAILADEGGIPHHGDPPPTDNWALTPTYDAATNTARVELSIDNAADLAAYAGAVSKTWSNVDLGGGAWLNSLILSLDGDPVVNLSFSVAAGSADTTFDISSSLLTFATIGSAEGMATAGITVSDTGDTDGVTASGLFEGSKFYNATYSGGSNFAYLIDSPVGTIFAGDSNSQSQSYPGAGLYASMGSVFNMRSEFKFVLSAGDTASTTSNYRVRAVVPEPGSLLALASGMAGLFGMALRRRRA